MRSLSLRPWCKVVQFRPGCLSQPRKGPSGRNLGGFKQQDSSKTKELYGTLTFLHIHGDAVLSGPIMNKNSTNEELPCKKHMLGNHGAITIKTIR